MRDYGEETKVIWGGDNCEHEWTKEITKRPNASGGQEYIKLKGLKGSEFVNYKDRTTKSDFCQKCSAWFGQLGLEPTLDLFIEHLLAITQELKRVLKPTGVMFWNHGDCYNSQGTNMSRFWDGREKNMDKGKPMLVDKKIPTKCLCLQNFRLILKMIDDDGDDIYELKKDAPGWVLTELKKRGIINE